MSKNVRSKNARRKKFARNRISPNVIAQKINDDEHRTKNRLTSMSPPTFFNSQWGSHDKVRPCWNDTSNTNGLNTKRGRQTVRKPGGKDRVGFSVSSQKFEDPPAHTLMGNVTENIKLKICPEKTEQVTMYK